jgi:hypothetical protein
MNSKTEINIQLLCISEEFKYTNADYQNKLSYAQMADHKQVFQRRSNNDLIVHKTPQKSAPRDKRRYNDDASNNVYQKQLQEKKRKRNLVPNLFCFQNVINNDYYDEFKEDAYPDVINNNLDEKLEEDTSLEELDYDWDYVSCKYDFEIPETEISDMPSHLNTLRKAIAESRQYAFWIGGLGGRSIPCAPEQNLDGFTECLLVVYTLKDRNDLDGYFPVARGYRKKIAGSPSVYLHIEPYREPTELELKLVETAKLRELRKLPVGCLPWCSCFWSQWYHGLFKDCKFCRLGSCGDKREEVDYDDYSDYSNYSDY